MALTLLRGYLGFIALFHVAVGVLVNVSPAATRALAAGYGADRVEWTPQFRHILRPLGAFMIALGVLAAVAVRDPLAHAPVVLGFVLLFALRAAQRLAFGGEIAAAFGIAPRRNLANALVFAAQALLLFALWRAAGTATGGAGG